MSEDRKFDEAAFDAAVAKPNGWSNVEDPVAEIRRMRGDAAYGNTAAMREALEKCAELGDQIDNWLGSDEATVWNCRNERSAAHNIMLTARAALAALARNCDRFATAEEARTAFLCDARNTEGLDHLVRLTEIVGRVCDWLFDKAKGKETDNG